ncbi:MAG TPA: tRNA glutamyl-Q(34) synthetase GluQRS [Patescibacteria group bacterium]|nr:tRNA glutamyl-Q(34) synthetase GluQRS [Patescibacteria group bacterium]
MPYRGRFAPSPTGDLHFGSLVAALGSWLRARSQHGQWLVRIEDLDPPREVAGSAERILDVLKAFAMVPDEAVVRQSERHRHYETALQLLIDRGFAFPCACSRTQLSATDGLHVRACAAPRPGVAHAWRARVPDIDVAFDDAVVGHFRQSLRRDVGDFVLKRSDGLHAYQLAVVVDDAAQGISEVVRGADLLDSTPRQIWLQRVLGLPTPGYLHLPLVLDESGRKLGKSHASVPIVAGDPLPALRAALRFLGQDHHPGCSDADALLQRAVASFSVRDIPVSVLSRIGERSD